MGINVVPLDSSHEDDPPTVLVGKDILVMFKSKPPLLQSNRNLPQLIARADLLQDTTTLQKLKELQVLTDRIEKAIANAIQLRDAEIQRTLLETIFKRTRELIRRHATRISSIEDELQLYLAEEHRLHFCSTCEAYLGLATDPLPEICKICDTPTVRAVGGTESFRYLNGDIRDYLQGIWIQDYIAKVLKWMGWETWTECGVMGSSGVYHPVDILAIDKTKGRVLIAECKRSAIGDHAFKLAAQFLDIQPSFGLLVTINRLNSDQGRNLLAKKPGLKLVEVENFSDQMIRGALEDYIARDN